jgi:cytochrome c oxidase assembly protein subunit 15
MLDSQKFLNGREEMPNNSSLFRNILGFAVLLALIVIVLGAYTRLSDAGLGCPDWPGCYGQLSVPDKVTGSEFERPLESGKAWKEMIHRYVAGTLGLLILAILFMVIKGLPKTRQSVGLPLLLLATVIFQALLGMWTVTLLLSPIIVTAHLMGGMTTISLLWWLYLNQKDKVNTVNSISVSFGIKVASLLALLLVIFQIFLGGWTSSNYAAVACGIDFPTCATQWWPKMDFVNGFDLSHKPGVNYEFGVLDSPARMAIQVVHRIGALVVFVYLLGLSIALFKQTAKLASLLFVLLIGQVSLGIMNVVFALPLEIAVLHNFVAVLLLLTVIAINHKLFKA